MTAHVHIFKEEAGGNWFAQVPVPAELVPYFGTTRLTQDLSVKTELAALNAAGAAIATLQAQIEAAGGANRTPFAATAYKED